jgi:hypothetical protein
MPAFLTPAMLASVAVMTSGCSFSDDMLTSIGMPDSQSTAARAEGMVGVGRAHAAQEHLTLTPKQQEYLEALTDAGVQPSDEIIALSIGSYICQARGADQSEQAVWDFVLPLVRQDVRDAGDARFSSAAPAVGEVDTATADYIRIASEWLC